MKILKTASAVLKDKNSILLAKLSRKSSYRNPDLETAIIKATSHDESKIDYKNAQRVFNWVRNSSTFIKPSIWSLSTRMEKTRSWVVALKGLMLMHGIFCCKIPIVKKIGRLPFDLSNFHDCHSKSNRIWSLSAFVRAYFAFLDQKSAFDSEEDHGLKQRPDRREAPMVQVLEELQRSQQLLDMLIQIRPDGINTYTLILEAMDCIIVEIFDVYSKICSGIAGILVGILGASQLEAKMALRILQKAASQGDELSSYFEFCKDIGVLNASEFPKVEQIPEEDIRDLEKIIMNGVSEKKKLGGGFKSHHHHQSREEKNKDQNAKINSAKAVVTRDWVVFDDDFSRPVIDIDDDNDHKNNGDTPNVMINQNYHQDDPFAASVNYPPLIVCGYEDDHQNNQYASNALVQFDHYYYSNQGGAAYITNGFNNQTSLVLSQYQVSRFLDIYTHSFC